MTDKDGIRCANFMDLESIRKTVEEYEKRFGAPDGSTYILPTDCHNCIQCFYGIRETATLVNAIGQATGDILSKAEALAIQLTGEPFKRKCFKEVSKEASRNAQK